MFTAKDYALPQNLEEAWETLIARKTNHIVAGCAWLRMGSKRINTAVDLSQAGLDFINDTGEAIEIGAMTSYRSVETSPLLQENFGGMLSHAVAPIIGVQFRNTVTVGGSVFSRFGFSDFLTPLMVTDATVKLYKGGLVPLAEFMEMPYKKDILEKIIIKKEPMRASYQNLRGAEADFPIVNLAVSMNNSVYKVAVGARPKKAVPASETAAFLAGAPMDDETIAKAADILAGEIPFGTNMRAGANYRQQMAKVLLKRALKEVWGC